jgi:uncharacterized membrane protein YfcA
VLFALVGAAMIGISLGLMGSGGSILTVPVLHYLVGQPDKVAIAGSAFVVGSIACVGGVQRAWHRSVDWRSVLFFGVPSMASAYLTAWASRWVPGTFQLGLFVLVMFAAGSFMLRPQVEPQAGKAAREVWKIGLDGLAVGALTGLVGVGGGFLIVPALVLLGGLDINRAIGTSLLIIALNSFSSFAKHVDVVEAHGQRLDWTVLTVFVGIGVVGSIAGTRLAQRLDRMLLQRMFAGLLFVMGAAMTVGLALETLGGDAGDGTPTSTGHEARAPAELDGLDH